MNNHVHKVADVILHIEAEMRRIGIWETEPPPRDALSSTFPFCYDKLAFNQWLQWVCLPKTKLLIEQNRDLPETSDIYPLAEECFAIMDVETKRLLKLIMEFDELLTQI
jgi:uncharacterized protein YqcC (DUF446 family)